MAMTKLTIPVRRRSVLLILANLKSEEFPVAAAPTALPTLGAAAREHPGLRIEYLDEQLETAFSERVEELCTRGAANGQHVVLALSAQTGSHESLRLISAAVHRFAEQPRLVLIGNVLGTYAPEQVLELWPEALVCRGPGEPVIRHALREASGTTPQHSFVERVPNVHYLDRSGNVRFTHEEASALAEQPAADWSGLHERYDLRKYHEVWIEHSRGCPHKRSGVGCTYCAITPELGSRDWRARDPGHVIEEIRFLASIGLPHLRFADEEFMANQPEQATDFAADLRSLRRELRSTDASMPTFDAAVRVDDIIVRGDKSDNVPEHVRALHTAGFRQLYLGIESGSRSQLKRFNKGVTPEMNARAIAILRRAGIRAACGWIMFDPLMPSLADVDENLKFVNAQQLIPVAPTDDFITDPLSRMRVLADTPYESTLRDRGLLGSRLDNFVEFGFEYLSAEVANVVSYVEQWRADLSRPSVYAMKNEVSNLGLAGERGGNQTASRFLSLKKLDYDYLAELLQAGTSPPTGWYDEVLERFRSRRDVTLAS